MRRIFPFLFTLLFSFNFVSAQGDSKQEQQRAKYEKEVQQRQNEMISDFVEELKVDDFQKEIISQKLHSYVQRKTEILKQSNREIERRERLDILDRTHFADVAVMSTPEVMNQIQDFITMKNPPKKKKKKKNKSKDSDN
ncbi:hypothetical protein SAMN03097699_1134 [Flavobacteriaceae bacterium MAR_2010_188]|nr:hypothetical protein SAMN03097699_1134 [Flavobacteriaceae bacterium MAR_2010_188]